MQATLKALASDNFHKYASVTERRRVDTAPVIIAKSQLVDILLSPTFQRPFLRASIQMLNCAFVPKIHKSLILSSSPAWHSRMNFLNILKEAQQTRSQDVRRFL